MSASDPAHLHVHGHDTPGTAGGDVWRMPPLLPRHAPSPAAWVVLLLIGLYRRAISPLLPPSCRFMPSCSEYGYEAVARYGILSGGRLAAWRILRCNPFGGSGYDPVP